MISADDIVDSVREPLLVLSADLRIQRANRSFYQTFRVTPAEAEGALIYELGNGQWNTPALRKLLEEILPQSTTVDDFEVTHDFPAIGWRSMLLNARIVRGTDAAAESILLSIEDVTERKRTEDRLRESEERFRALVKASSDVVYRMGPDWTEMRFLQGKDFTADTNEPTRSWLDKYIHPDDQLYVMETIREAVRTKSVFQLEHRVLRVDGSLGWTFSRAIPMMDAEGEITEWFGAASDITARKLAEQSLRASEERYRTLFESMEEGFCVVEMLFDEDGRAIDYRFLEVNPAFVTQSGLTGVVGRTMRQVIPSLDPKWFEFYGDIATTGVSRRVAEPIDGIGGWWDIQAFRLGGPDSRRVAVLFNDITARMRAENERREADRHKDEFLATLAHELRNPLAPMRSGLQIMKLVKDDPEAVEQSRASMERQLGQMVHLIDDLMDLSRVSRGQIELRKNRVELATVVQQAVETSRPLIDEEGHHFAVDVVDVPLYVDADTTRLTQVFSNLLNNAAKYTKRGGHIRLSVIRRDGDAVVSVQDDGMGIPSEMLKTVFDIFTQGDHNRANAQGGLGIGLSLVKKLVEMHGGRVEARSGGHGLGSEFIVTLPVASAVAEPDRAATGAGAGVPAKRRILVADDNVDAASSLAMLLQLMGNEVRTANDGMAAVEEAASFQPEVILLDLGMPKLNGLDACRQIRNQPGGKNRVLIALTGWGQEEDRRRTVEAGFDHHIVKPIDYDQLGKLLDSRPGVQGL